MPFNIDPALPVPLGVQLRGVIEYGIVCGQLQPGERLPPVRSMARQLGIAPMTVSQVYKELKEAGLLEAKPGNGTFVSSTVASGARPELRGLQQRIDQLLEDALGLGLSGGELVALVNARINRRSPGGRGLRLIFVGLFEEATRAYGADIRAHLPAGDSIQTTTLAEVAASELARRRLVHADLVLTLFNRKTEVARLVGSKKPVLGVHYIPSERTRTLLAQIDPLASVAIISTFPEFLPIMKAGVQRFAPHVQDIEATLLESPDLAAVLERTDTAVFATGSERVVGLLRPGTRSFEYRHTPDPHEIDQMLIPMLEALRSSALPAANTADFRRSHEN